MEENIDATLPAGLLIMCDNRSAVALSKSDEVHPRSRHYALRMYTVKQERDRIHFIRTDVMCADALTKGVAGKQRALLLGFDSVIPT